MMQQQLSGVRNDRIWCRKSPLNMSVPVRSQSQICRTALFPLTAFSLECALVFANVVFCWMTQWSYWPWLLGAVGGIVSPELIKWVNQSKTSIYKKYIHKQETWLFKRRRKTLLQSCSGNIMILQSSPSWFCFKIRWRRSRNDSNIPKKQENLYGNDTEIKSFLLPGRGNMSFTSPSSEGNSSCKTCQIHKGCIYRTISSSSSNRATNWD